MLRAVACTLAFTIAAGLPLGSRAAETGTAPAPGEPTWKTVVLAPGRVVANGRFDAARPSYGVERAEQRAAAEAERAAGCQPCVCAKN